MNIFPVTALSEGPIAASQWPEARSSDATDTPRADHMWSVPRVTTIAAGDSISQPRHARSSVDGSRIGLLSPLAGVVSIFAVGGVESRHAHSALLVQVKIASRSICGVAKPTQSRSSARPDCNSFRMDRARMDASSHGGLINLPARRNGSVIKTVSANANALRHQRLPYYYPLATCVGRYRLAETYQPRESKSRLPLIPLPLSPLAGIAHAGAGFSLRGIRE
jgi:hypothetical protein